jgi:DNA invertase Pin-like site-specific DNA recombinase
MASRDAAAIVVSQVANLADYDTLREVVNQLAGLLVDRQRSAGTSDEAEAWRLEHRTLRAQLDDIQPGTTAVTEALDRWSRRLAELRGPVR